MKKKFLSALLVMALLAAPLAGCGGGDPFANSGDGWDKTLKIKAIRDGWGVDWLEETVKEFNRVYAAEGYNAVITEAEPMLNLNEISTPKRSDTDLWFAYAQTNSFIDTSRTALKTNERVLMEDLTEMLNLPAIGADKKEQGGPIIDRIRDSMKPEMKYTGILTQWQNKYYSAPYMGTVAGLAINKKILDGLHKEIPLTSDQLIQLVNDVAPSPWSATAPLFPIAHPGANAAGYGTYALSTMFAQYSGYQKWVDFQLVNPSVGTAKTDGWRVYEDDGLLEALKVWEQIIYKDHAPANSISMNHISAQAQLMMGNSLIMPTGSWVYKEMRATYPDNLNDVVMMKVPVISALGTKIGLPSDAALGKIVSMVDEAKTNGEIKAQVLSDHSATVTDGQIDAVRDARGIYYDLGTGYQAYIPSYADSREVAKLFLRFMYSDDGMKIFRGETYTDMPLGYVGETPAPAASISFMQSAYDIFHSPQSKDICIDNNTSPLRRVGGLNQLFPNGAQSETFAQFFEGSVTGQKVYDDTKDKAKDNWPNYVRNAGL